MEWLWGALGGVVIGGVAGPLVEPWSRRLQRLGRRAALEKPVDVHVEWDQAVIWSGWPPWMSFSNYFASELPSEPPPEDGRDWSGWADRNGGVDLGLSMLRLTIVAKSDATVVLDTPMVSQKVRPVPPGVGVLKPAPGGPDVNPRRYEIKLDMGERPWVEFQDESSPRPAPSWLLNKGDVEQLHIWARAEDDQLHEWVMELPLLVAGRRVRIPVDRGGKPFVTVGQAHPHQHLWRPNDEWLSWKPRENPPGW